MKIGMCRYCGKRFKARANKHFCSDRCRHADWSVKHEPCIYCGSPANTIDHIPPQSMRQALIDLEIDTFEFLEVSACHECNCALGAKSLFTIAERKAYIKEWLRERYKKYLAMPEWGDEKKDLGRGLTDYITASEIVAKVTRQRLRW